MIAGSTSVWKAVAVAALLIFGCANVKALVIGDAAESIKAFDRETHGRYLSELERYRKSEDASRVAGVIERCRFIEHFAYAEDLSWAEEASADLHACQDDLKQRNGATAEAQLYLLEQKFGQQLIDAGEPLLAEAEHWTAPQRAKLHEILAGAYANTGQSKRAGEEALQAVEFDPNNVRLSLAVEYLAESGRTVDAQRYLAAAEIPPYSWGAEQRLRAALKLSDPQVAVHELDRYLQAGLKISESMSARVYFAAGRVADAAAQLQRGKSSKAETAELTQLRFDVALANGNAALAIEALRRSLADFEDIGSWMKNYVLLVRQSPSSLLNVQLMPATLALLAVLLLICALPALMLVPVHYRGLGRRVQGRAPSPMFEHLRLRDVWAAFVISEVVSILVFSLLSPSELPFLFGEKGHASGDTLAQAALWSTIAGLLVLFPLWRRFEWSELTGDLSNLPRLVLQVVLAWLLVFGLAYISFRVRYSFGKVVPETLHTRAIDAITRSISDHGSTFAAFAMIGLLIPLFEELLFRGVLLGGLSRHISFGWANFLQAAVFALVHNDTPRLLFYFAMGLVCGVLARKWRGLLAPFLLHALNNSVAVALKLWV